MRNGVLYHSQLRLRFKLMKKTVTKLTLSVAMIIFMNFSLADGNPFTDGYHQDTNPFGDGYIQNDNPFAEGYVQDTNPFGEGYVQDKGIFEENLR